MPSAECGGRPFMVPLTVHGFDRGEKDFMWVLELGLTIFDCEKYHSSNLIKGRY